MGAFRDQMERDLRTRGRSENTIYTYLLCMRYVVAYFMRPPDQLTLENIKSFLDHVANDLKVSFSKFNQFVAALRFFYSVTVKRDWSVQELRYQKRWRRVPQVLSQQEVEHLFDAASSLRALAMLMTLYSTGLRLGECRWLKLSDIDRDRRMIRVEKGKGKKDRFVMLSPLLESTLDDYIWEAQPRFFLWENPKTGQPYNDTTIQQEFRDARKAAGITKLASVHTLRHYADCRIMPRELSQLVA